MAKTVGVDPGDALVKVVEIDGSYRKPRLLRVHTEPLAEGRPKSVSVAAAVRTAVDDGMKGEVRLGHPCREAVLRMLDLPFKGRDAIRKVVKAEVEGEIHGYSVDDMIVDFHEVGGSITGGSRVMVAAVPKDGLRAQLNALEAVAIEPQTVDLDTMALWRAADWVGAFDVDEDDAADPDPSLLTAVVDVGSRSVKVLLVEGDRLIDMRALRLGGSSIVDDIGQRYGLPHASAEEAVNGCNETGAAFTVEVASELPAAVSPAAVSPAGVSPAGVGDDAVEVSEGGAREMRSVTVAANEVDAACTAFLQRLKRELFRYLASAGKGNVRAVWLTGGASQMSGLAEVLTEAFGVDPRELDLLGNMQHSLDDEEAAELGPRLAVAIGLALTPLGGPTGFNLRQEDLVYTRGFERIKFPLTITLMVALLALFVYGNHRAAVLNNFELEIGKTYYGPKKQISFFGMVNSVLVGGWWESRRNFLFERSKGKDYRWKDLRAELLETPVHKRVRLLRDKLRQVAAAKQKESGIYEDVSLESGYAVLVRFSEIMQRLEGQLGRYLLTRLTLNMKGPNRTLAFHIAFRGEDFRIRNEVLKTEFDREFLQPDTPFEKQTGRQDTWKENLFRDTKETGIVGSYYVVTLKIKESFDPFGRGGNAGAQR